MKLKLFKLFNYVSQCHLLIPQTLGPQGCCLGLGPVLEALKSEISPARWRQHQSEALPPFSAKASSFSGIS